MKSYKECAESVLARRDEYLENAKRRRAIAVRSASVAVCICAAAGIVAVSPWSRKEVDVPPVSSTGTESDWAENDTTVTTESESDKTAQIVVSYTSSKMGDWIIPPPAMGEVYVFPDLDEARTAFAEQGVKFLVFIDIIDGHERYLLEEEREAEYARLEALGYESADIYVAEPDVTFRQSRAFNLTEAQIANFAASEEYGYLLRFTGEDEDNLNGEIGYLTCEDGSVCIVLNRDGETSLDKFADRPASESETVTYSDDLG